MSNRTDDMPCGGCNCGIYALGAVLAGIEQYAGIETRKAALSATPLCTIDPTHICFGDRDFVLSITFPFDAEQQNKLRNEVLA